MSRKSVCCEGVFGMLVKKTVMSRWVICTVALSCLAAGSLVQADDWPNWRGPTRDGISKEMGWLSTWPAEGPKVLWKASIGIGFASMTVSEGRVYAMGHVADADVVYCFDAVTGQEIWKKSYPSELYPNLHEGGPCATPTVDGNSVYTLSKGGEAIRFDKVTGAIVWLKNIAKETGAKDPTWNFSGSAVPFGDLVVYSVGTSGLALKKTDGSVAWTSGAEPCGYATAVPATLAGKKCYVINGANDIFGIDPATGKILWQNPIVVEYNINATDVVVVDSERIFVSTGYNNGCGLWKIGADGKVSELWRNKNLNNQFNASVLWQGYLYGFHGNVGGSGKLTCLDVNTGEVKWSQSGLGTGSLILADGKLIVLGEQGKLVIVPASPDGYKELASAEILKGKCWTSPVLANGLLYARNAAGDLVCIDLRGKK
jgi:outer membrane protein assembly factor BamB